MSAFIHEDSHVIGIVHAVRVHRLAPVTIDDICCNPQHDPHADLLVRILMAENIRSVNARYDENTPLFEGIKWQEPQTKAVSLFGLHLAIGSLDYQSCETEDWRESFACRLLQAWTAEIEQRTGHTGESIRNAKEYEAEQTWKIQ